ncbi:MAG: protein-glutamate O-methyltransferase CheR [Xanthomonadales bacterium]|nr:protein-glutamate O-methyltransferase CheR [Xanthomonadales bacterium]
MTKVGHPAASPPRKLAVGQPSLIMDDGQFQRWVQLLEKRTGIVIPAARREFLESNLRQRMRETGHRCFDDYYSELQNGVRGALEWTTLVDRLTVHQTHFFRHQPSLSYIKDQWLPEYTARAEWTGAIEAWSVGCATGEEAYSLGMVLESGLAHLGRPAYFGVSATDVSHPALAVGRQARYSNSKLREIPGEYIERHVERIDDELFTIRDSVRRRIAFSVFNLLELDRLSVPTLDLVYCQNVLIYFARELRIQLLNRLAEVLKPGGVIILGSGELMGYVNPALERVNHRAVLAFRRRNRE